MTVKWAYGVTTVPSRRSELLPRTLISLRKAGFDKPHLFVDGDCDGVSWSDEFGLNVTCRGGDPVRTFGNWVTSLIELYCRHPDATHFAMFQDDFVTYLNLREYLERALFPTRSYLNLYTFPSNTAESLRENGHSYPSKDYTGFYQSNQNGRGAVGLVFRKKGVQTLLSAEHMIMHPQGTKGHKSVDGGIVTSMLKAGWFEYVHYPTLVQHTGDESAMGNNPHVKGVGFLGETHNALNFLK